MSGPAGRRRSRSGNTLLTVVLALVAMGAAVVAISFYHFFTLRTLTARNAIATTGYAAEGAARVMMERVVARAQEQLGMLTQADLDSLNAALGTLSLPDGITLDPTASGYTLIAARTGDVVPYDVVPLAVTTDQPRWSYTVTPALAGARTLQTLEVEVRATVTGQTGGRRTATGRLAISKVPPFQHVLYAAGTLEICVSGGSTAAVSGSVRADGVLVSWCDGARTFSGDLYAASGITVSGAGSQRVVWDGGSAPLTTVTREVMIQNVGDVLATWGGRVRVGAALGDQLMTTQWQDQATAGRGECPDFEAACGGASNYFPSIQLRRDTTGPSTIYTLTCGYAYNGSSCANLKTAITYVPFPFTDSAGAAGAAWPDPANPGQPWHGLFPDYRREPRCMATVGGNVYRTFRCPTNAYGYVIDVGALAPIPGGVFSIRKASTTTPLTNASGYQEVVLLTNATTLAAPLTIHSELPVYIAGSFNVTASQPALIDAPLITVVPADVLQQFAAAALWDSVATTVPTNLRATSDVSITAVLRAPFHVTGEAGYYGGTLEQLPSVLGDWSGVGLHVLGAVEGREVPVGAAGSYSTAFWPYGAEPSEMHVVQPSTRELTYDTRLLTAAFQPRGSWYFLNLPPAGVGSRTRTRQAQAVGGYTVIRLTQEIARVAP